MNTMTVKITRIATYLLLLAALLGFSLMWLAQAQAASLPAESCTLVGTVRTCELWAKASATGQELSMPGGSLIPFWGYSSSETGAPELPGPEIIANQGETVQVILHNMLGETSGLSFPGQAIAPDQAGVPAYDGITILSKTYTLANVQPGTFLYEAALLPNAQHQVAMGMYGALIVRPAGAPLQAYADAATAFGDEALLVLSEIDPALNTSAAPAAFDMRNYAPKYWLINGKAYPDTEPINADSFVAGVGSKLLLRYVNAGLLPHTMDLLGLDQTLLASDGYPLPYTRRVGTNNIPAGQTLDTLVTMPATAPAGGGKYALYDGSLLLHNNGAAGFGGMLTFINLADGTPPGGGPVTTLVTVLPPKTGGAAPGPVALSATIPGATSAQYFIDDNSLTGTPITMVDDTGDLWTASVDVSTLPHGPHTLYVRGSDGVTWGAFNFASLYIDKEGPMTSGIALSPNPSNGSVAVSISATANDSMHGDSNVVEAEYMIDDPMGTQVLLTVSPSAPFAPIASLTGSIPVPALGWTEGEHTVYVHSTDEFDNHNMHETALLKVDKSGPVASSVSATPSTLYAAAVVRVNATLSDPLVGVAPFPGVNSIIKKAEGFICKQAPPACGPGANGTGFPLTPRDGLFNSQTELAYADIPLATVNALGAGTHTVYVHGQDSSGNWGDASLASATFTLLPDLIFADGFESGNFSAWLGGTGGTAGVVSVTSAAARTVGGSGMQAVLAGNTPGYAIDTLPNAEPGYRARFYFNPNSTATGSATPDIFVGLNSANTVAFRVQYRRTNQGAYQVRAVVTRSGGTTATNWYAINNNAWNAVEISWASGTAASFRLYTGGTLRQTLTNLNTNAYKLDAVWLGPSGSLGNNVSGTMYFDDFVSRRTQYIGL